MSRFIISGDTHGSKDLSKVVRYFEEHNDYNEDDYLIILGDVQVCGFSGHDEEVVRETLRNLPVTTLFIDGNHEDFNSLNSYPVDEWNGGKVHIIEKGIIHLMRGQVYDIDGTTFFSFGGGASIDKEVRSEGFDWFEEEIPSDEEYKEGLLNLKKNGYEVDFILTHTGPREVISAMGYGEENDDEIKLRRYLQQIADNVDFSEWYFGHFHEDMDIENFHCRMDEVEELCEPWGRG